MRAADRPVQRASRASHGKDQGLQDHEGDLPHLSTASVCQFRTQQTRCIVSVVSGANCAFAAFHRRQISAALIIVISKLQFESFSRWPERLSLAWIFSSRCALSNDVRRRESVADGLFSKQKREFTT